MVGLSATVRDPEELRRWLGAALQTYFGINLIFTWQGAVIAAAIVAFPLVYKPARAAFEGVDHQLEQAARVLGVSEAAVFFRVTLPLTQEGLIIGGTLVFTGCVTAYITPALLGGLGGALRFTVGR